MKTAMVWPGRNIVTTGMAAILVVAALLRLRGLAFGLPALYDPDEPMFFLNALKLLREKTLNPGWFGHPGTTTIYALAIVDIMVLGAGMLTGRFNGPDDFGRAIYADPAVVVMPGRVFIMMCGLATIILVFVLARRLFGTRAGLIAAGLLAIDPVHIKYSQIIRTDMHETVFLLLCMLACVNIARSGRTSDYLLAAAWLGLAVATKWPAALMVVAIAGAAVHRALFATQRCRVEFIRFIIACCVALTVLVVVSPYLVVDFSTVLANLGGEVQAHHPGATGRGFLSNVWWYLAHPFRDALSLAGLAAAAVGMVIAVRHSSLFAAIVVPFFLISIIMISGQGLIWERWIVPFLPFATIAVAVAVDAVFTRLRGIRARVAGLGVLAVIVVPSLLASEVAAHERLHDTRAAASAWARAHVAPGDTVIIEQLAFDLLETGWRFLYPVGNAGCVDVAASLKARIPYSTIGRWRGDRAVLDIGTIDPATFGRCRADWAIMVDYDRYQAEPATYAAELRIYHALIAQGRIVATFRPERGRQGGPIVRIVRLDRRSPGWRALAPLPES